MTHYNFRHIQELSGLIGQFYDDSFRLYRAIIDHGIPEAEAVRVAARRYTEAGSVDAALRRLTIE
jgi:hypothetical protein